MSKITVYQKPTCTTCRNLHALLKRKNVDFKWGYELQLKDLDFLAKIDITSEQQISPWNKN